MNNTSYLSIGSNLGNRETTIIQGIKTIEKSPNISIREQSSVYETDPVGYIDQHPFLNMVIVIKTSFSAQELLAFLQDVEHELGRTRQIKWGPRTIDLDILLFNKENINSERLIIPHPRMFERGFVMIPLFEVYPTIQQDFNLIKFPDKRGVRMWKRNIGEGVLEHSES
jgi:2-amino-4-hydroxy-6-hydroxymethyldihydropteridine diphosphokinase